MNDFEALVKKFVVHLVKHTLSLVVRIYELYYEHMLNEVLIFPKTKKKKSAQTFIVEEIFELYIGRACNFGHGIVIRLENDTK